MIAMSMESLSDHPVGSAIAFVALLAVAFVAGLLLRAGLRQVRSIAVTLTVTALASLLLALGAAAVASQMMVLSGRELRVFALMLAISSIFAAVLSVVASRPLVDDVRRLGVVANSVERGDRAVRTGVSREDELGHTARAIDQMLDRLDLLEQERGRAENERQALFTNISHDLRTPLAAMRAAVEALADGVAPDPRRYAQSMRHDLSALGSLIDDLFLLSRLDAGRVELRRSDVDLNEIIDEAVGALTPSAEQRRVALVFSPGRSAMARVDPSALGRVLRNLIDNAIDHSPPDGAVTIEIEPGPIETVVTVRDDGTGFPAEFRDRAFDSFSRADASRARSTGGAGLGLAICRALIEAHGGRTWIGSGPGGAVSFAVPV